MKEPFPSRREQFPSLTFKSTRVTPGDDGAIVVTGDLTIRGVTRSIELHVERNGRLKDPWGNDRAGFTARATVDRKDFGLTWNKVLDSGGLAIGDKVSIEIELEAVRQAASAQAA